MLATCKTGYLYEKHNVFLLISCVKHFSDLRDARISLNAPTMKLCSQLHPCDNNIADTTKKRVNKTLTVIDYISKQVSSLYKFDTLM